MLHLTSGGRAGAYTKLDNPNRTCRSSCTSRRGTGGDTREFHFDDIHNDEGVVDGDTCLPGRLDLGYPNLEVGRNLVLERG